MDWGPKYENKWVNVKPLLKSPSLDESKWTSFLQRKCLKFKQEGRKRWVGDQTWPTSQGLEWGSGSTLRWQPPAPRVGWEVREASGPPDDAPEECLGRGCSTREHLQEGGGNRLQLCHWGADREGMAAIAISLSSWLFCHWSNAKRHMTVSLFLWTFRCDIPGEG